MIRLVYDQKMPPYKFQKMDLSGGGSVAGGKRPMITYPTEHIKFWKILPPDGDGDVYLEIDKGGGSFEMVNLGKMAEVFDALADWCSRFDPE